MLDGDQRHQRHSVFHANELLDVFDGRQLDIHVQRRVVLLERLDDFFAVGTEHAVSDEVFGAQVFDADFISLRHGMPRVNDQRQFVAVEHVRGEFVVVGTERDHAELDVVIEDHAGHFARQGAHDLDADHGMHAMKHVQYRQQVARSEFVGGDDQLALVEHA